jgi:transcriptional regulator with XRE-family HTH domain
MKRTSQKVIALTVGISAPYLNQILHGVKRPMWPVAKRLASLTNSSPEQWLEAPPETLRQIIAEYGQSQINERTAP